MKMRLPTVHAHMSATSNGQAKDRLVSRPLGAGLRQPSSRPILAAARGIPPLTKKGENRVVCSKVHPIGSFAVRHWHSCDECPTPLRLHPSVWHLDSHAGVLRPPGWSRTQGSRKRDSSLCSLFTGVKRFCSWISSPAPNMIRSEEQDEDEEDAGMEEAKLEKPLHMRAFDPKSASVEEKTSDTPSFWTSLARITAISMGSASDADDGISAKELEFQKMRRKVMELEAVNLSCTNQLKRQDHEMKQVKVDKERLAKANEELAESIRAEKLKLIQKESELHEAMQNLQELRVKISLFENKKTEKWSRYREKPSTDSCWDTDSISANEHDGSIDEDIDTEIDGLAVAFSALYISERRDANIDDGGSDSDSDSDEEDAPQQQAPPSPPPAPVVAVHVQVPVLLLGSPAAAPVLRSPSPQPRLWTLTPAWLGRAGLLRLRLDDRSAVPRRLLFGIRNGMPAQETATHLEVLLICIDEALHTYKLILDDVLLLNRWTPFIGRALDSSLNNSRVDLDRLERLLPKIIVLLENSQ